MKVKITSRNGYRCKGTFYGFGSVVDIKTEYFNPQVMVKVEETKPETVKTEETKVQVQNTDPICGELPCVEEKPDAD